MKIKVTVDDAQVVALFSGLKEAIDPKRVDKLLLKEAEVTRGRLVDATPRRWTGDTKRQWRTAKIRGGYLVTNDSKVMRFLEKGTKAHGPKKAKALYIPLVKQAMFGYRSSFTFGIHYVLAKRVKGIKAMKIVEKERPLVRERLEDSTTEHLKHFIAKSLS